MHDLCFAFAGQEIDVFGVPFGVELEIAGIVPLCSVGKVNGDVVVVLRKASAGTEKVDAVVVFPRLEIQSEFGVVFRIKLINGDFCPDFGVGLVIFRQHIGIYHAFVRIPITNPTTDCNSPAADDIPKSSSSRSALKIYVSITSVVEYKAIGIDTIEDFNAFKKLVESK